MSHEELFNGLQEYTLSFINSMEDKYNLQETYDFAITEYSDYLTMDYQKFKTYSFYAMFINTDTIMQQIKDKYKVDLSQFDDDDIAKVKFIINSYLSLL